MWAFNYSHSSQMWTFNYSHSSQMWAFIYSHSSQMWSFNYSHSSQMWSFNYSHSIQRTCAHKITNLPTQVNISDNLYFLCNCNNMYTHLILGKDKYLICSLRVHNNI